MKKKIDQTVTWSELCAAVGKLPDNRLPSKNPHVDSITLFNLCVHNIFFAIRGLNTINAADQLPARLFELCETNTPEIGETFD